jgi:hypothetical protein
VKSMTGQQREREAVQAKSRRQIVETLSVRDFRQSITSGCWSWARDCSISRSTRSATTAQTLCPMATQHGRGWASRWPRRGPTSNSGRRPPSRRARGTRSTRDRTGRSGCRIWSAWSGLSYWRASRTPWRSQIPGRSSRQNLWRRRCGQRWRG